MSPNGQLKWKKYLGGWLDYGPIISDDGTIYISSWDRRHRKFIPFVITGDDDRFWHTDRVHLTMINKRSQKLSLYGGKHEIYTASQIKKILWIEENAHRIRQAVDKIHDYETLDAISKIIGIDVPLDDIVIPST